MSVMSESNQSFRLKIAEMVGELCSSTIDPSQEWPELYTATHSLSKSSITIDREIGMTLLGHISYGLMATTSSFLPQALSLIQETLLLFQQEHYLTGFITCMKAFSDLVNNLTSSESTAISAAEEAFATLIPSFFTIWLQFLEESSSQLEQQGQIQQMVLQYSEHWLEIVDMSPRLFHDHLPAILATLLPYLTKNNSSHSDRKKFSSNVLSQVLEFLVLLAEHSPAKIRKLTLEMITSNGTNSGKKTVKTKKGKKKTVDQSDQQSNSSNNTNRSYCYYLYHLIPYCIQEMISALTHHIQQSKHSIVDVWLTSDKIDDSLNNSSSSYSLGCYDFEMIESSLTRALTALGVKYSYRMIMPYLADLFSFNNNNNNTTNNTNNNQATVVNTAWIPAYTGLTILASYLEITIDLPFSSSTSAATDNHNNHNHHNNSGKIHRQEIFSLLIQLLQPTPTTTTTTGSPVIQQHGLIRYAASHCLSQFFIHHGKKYFDEISLTSSSSLLTSALTTSSSLTAASSASIQQQQQEHLLSQIFLPNIHREINPSPRIRRQILFTIISYLEMTMDQQASSDSPLTTSTSGLQINQLMSALLQIVHLALQQGPVLVQEMAITLIISLAEVTKSSTASRTSTLTTATAGMDEYQVAWSDIYPHLIPLLQQVLDYASSSSSPSSPSTMAAASLPQQQTLWIQTIEAMTLIGENVGRDVFYPQAQQLMFLLARMDEQISSYSSKALLVDVEIDQAITKAYVRIARILGQEFLPYLQTIMQKLFQAMQVNILIPKEEIEALAEKMNKGDGNEDDEDELSIDSQQDSEQGQQGQQGRLPKGVTMIEDPLHGQYIAVRTSLVEQQVNALQMILLLVEKLQGNYFPYVQQTIHFLLAHPSSSAASQSATVSSKDTVADSSSGGKGLIASPHEDVRSLCLAILPELVRSTAAVVTGQQQNSSSSGSVSSSNSSNSNGSVSIDKSSLIQLTSFLLGQIMQLLEKETSIELIMTALQAMKQSITITSTTITATATAAAANTAAAFLTNEQLRQLADVLKLILRDSLQRRAVFRAEMKLANKAASNTVGKGHDDGEEEGEEDHELEEEAFFQETLELHYNLSEVISALFKTHTSAFYHIYHLQSQWHEAICSLSYPYCLKEDRRFAYLVLCDVIEFGLVPTTVQYQQPVSILCPEKLTVLQQIMEVFIECCNTNDNEDDQAEDNDESADHQLRRMAAYGLGVAFHLHAASLFANVTTTTAQTLVLTSLQSLRNCVINLDDIGGQDDEDGEGDNNNGLEEGQGEASDNAIATVGHLIEQSLLYSSFIQLTSSQYAFLLENYFSCLPLQFDREEGEKAMELLMRLWRDYGDAGSIQAGLLLQQIFREDKKEQVLLVKLLMEALLKELFLQSTKSSSHNVKLLQEIRLFFVQLLDGSGMIIKNMEIIQLGMQQMSKEDVEQLHSIMS